MFGVAVNHFTKGGHVPVVQHSTELAVELLAGCPEVTTVVVSDGSAEPDERLADSCRRAGAHYLHQGRELGFAETFNEGVKSLSEDWVGLACSDVYVQRDVFQHFKHFVERRRGLPIGALIPFLNRSDVPVQEPMRFGWSRQDSDATLMSINLNVFHREVFDTLGGVPDQYTGTYNDIDMCVRLRELGRNVYLVGGAHAVHYGCLTRAYGSRVDYPADGRQFFVDHPHLFSRGAMWGLKAENLLSSPLLKAAYRAATLENRARLTSGRPERHDRFVRILKLVPGLQQL